MVEGIRSWYDREGEEENMVKCTCAIFQPHRLHMYLAPKRLFIIATRGQGGGGRGGGLCIRALSTRYVVCIREVAIKYN